MEDSMSVNSLSQLQIHVYLIKARIQDNKERRKKTVTRHRFQLNGFVVQNA